jgi:hypothetical protein
MTVNFVKVILDIKVTAHSDRRSSYNQIRFAPNLVDISEVFDGTLCVRVVGQHFFVWKIFFKLFFKSWHDFASHFVDT